MRDKPPRRCGRPGAWTTRKSVPPVQDSTHYTPERFFGTVAINDSCGVAACGKQAAWVYPVHEKHGRTGVSWLCAKHARTVADDIADNRNGQTTAHVQEISRTCRREGEHGNPCGKTALRVAIVGVRDETGPQLAVVGVCARHADPDSWGGQR
jgi:hypothetical protein